MKAVAMISTFALLLAATGCMSVPDEMLDDMVRQLQQRPPTKQEKAMAHYIAAIASDVAGDDKQALEELEEVVRMDPDALMPALKLVRLYIRQEEYEKAEKIMLRAVQQHPDESNYWIFYGEILHRLGRFEEAQAAFETSVALAPDNVLAYGALVELMESTNDLVSAIEIYERLLEINPNAGALHYQLGLALLRINDFEGAKAAFKQALRLKPGLISAYRFLGLLCLENGEYSEAGGHLRVYLSHRNDDSEALLYLAATHAHKEEWNMAQRAFKTLLAAEAAEPSHHIDAMLLYLLAGDPEAAEKAAPPAGSVYFASLFQAMAREDAGLPYLSLLESLDGLEEDLDQECTVFLGELAYIFGAKNSLGWMLARLEGYESELDSRTLGIIKGRLLMRLERHEEAIDQFETLLIGTAEDRWIHYYLAICNEALHRETPTKARFQATEKHLKAYLRYVPDDPEVLNFLAYFYAEYNKNIKDAEKLVKRALKITPDSPYYLDTLGWVLYQQKKYDRAILFIQQAIYRMERDDAILRDHLGDAYLKKGDPERALAEWKRARRLDPDLKGVQDKIDQLNSDTQ